MSETRLDVIQNPPRMRDDLTPGGGGRLNLRDMNLGHKNAGWKLRHKLQWTAQTTFTATMEEFLCCLVLV